MADSFAPVTSADVTDEKLVAGELRAFRAEMRTYFELLLLRLDRYEGRITALEQHRRYDSDRIDSHEQRLAALEAAAKTET